MRHFYNERDDRVGWLIALPLVQVGAGAVLVLREQVLPFYGLAIVGFCAFGALVMLWRAVAPTAVKGFVSLCIVAELLVLAATGGGLGTRQVRVGVGAALATGDQGDEPGNVDRPTAQIAIHAVADQDRHDADLLAREIERNLPDKDVRLQADLRVLGGSPNARLALAWSTGPEAAMRWCGTIQVFAQDATAGIDALARLIGKRVGRQGQCR